MHDEGVAVDIGPCGGPPREGLKQIETAELVRLCPSDEPHLGVALANLRRVGFVVMDDCGPAQPEPVGLAPYVNLGIADLLDEKAIARLNLRLATKMSDEIGDRKRLCGHDKPTIGDQHKADDARRKQGQ